MSDQQSEGIRTSREKSDGLFVCHISRINIIHLGVCVWVCVCACARVNQNIPTRGSNANEKGSTHTEDAIPRPQFTHPSSNTVRSHLDMTNTTHETNSLIPHTQKHIFSASPPSPPSPPPPFHPLPLSLPLVPPSTLPPSPLFPPPPFHLLPPPPPK